VQDYSLVLPLFFRTISSVLLQGNLQKTNQPASVAEGDYHQSCRRISVEASENWEQHRMPIAFRQTYISSNFESIFFLLLMQYYSVCIICRARITGIMI